MSSSIINKKYLSILTERFFNQYQHENQKPFVDFVVQWFKYAEESYVDDNGDTKFAFWKVMSNLENFINIDNIPNELLRVFLTHYANNFDSCIENIPFFVEFETDAFGNLTRVVDSYGKIIYKYDNIRLFLKTCKKFFASKGSYYSFLYLFRLFGGSLKMVPIKEDILILSDPNHKLSAPNAHGRMSHLHGIYNPATPEQKEWWYTYYTYRLETDLPENIYKPIILELVHPAGTKCMWKQKVNSAVLHGFGYDAFGQNDSKIDDWGNILSLSGLPQIYSDQSSITFDPCTVGLESNYKIVELRNVGEQDLIIDSISSLASDYTLKFTGTVAEAGHTPIGTTFPKTIGFGECFTFGIKFKPTIPTLINGTIVITSNSEDGAIKNINLSGYGL